MARRGSRKTTTRRRRKQGVSILGIAETVALSNVATQTLFNVNAYDFLTGSGENFGRANQITLRELMLPQQLTGYRQGQAGNRITTIAEYDSTYNIVTENLKENWMTGAVGMIAVPLTFKFGKALAKPAISRVNSLLRKAGIASTIKV